LLALLSGAGLLLLIACINMVSLLLARSDSRSREIGLRSALGASATRLVWQFATEALVLVAIGSALGLVVAASGMRSLGSLLTPDMISRMPYLQGFGLNLRLLAFSGGIALVAALVFTLAPGVLARQVAERVAGLSSVQAVGYADLVPLSGGLAPTAVFRKDGSPDEHLDDYPVRRVSAGYFAALQAKLLRGREFTEEEVAST